ncbi:hypothetical protein N7471_010728 [Penicillium samsonianum]|uniref:uncharacterized protein n=1 Tax=Penicillium samsonianum TaxID=1882272 RepID=UPI002549774D|nr:uncharacterized protein N7471_010728 [Penicillium samsonianum]KAJ6126235.1 hypothetical protein N7471_010728 [Penicillium samsonianum]
MDISKLLTAPDKHEIRAENNAANETPSQVSNQPEVMAPALLWPYHRASQILPTGPPNGPKRSTSLPIVRPPETNRLPAEDETIIRLCDEGIKRQDISKQLPERSLTSCHLHHQNYLEKDDEWDETQKVKLARIYHRIKSQMWKDLANELGVPWRAAEAIHWQLGEANMAGLANAVPFPFAIPTKRSFDKGD